MLVKLEDIQREVSEIKEFPPRFFHIKAFYIMAMIVIYLLQKDNEKGRVERV